MAGAVLEDMQLDEMLPDEVSCTTAESWDALCFGVLGFSLRSACDSSKTLAYFGIVFRDRLLAMSPGRNCKTNPAPKVKTVCVSVKPIWPI